MSNILNYIQERNLSEFVDVKANFCMENCDKGPSVSIGNTIITKAKVATVIKEIESQLTKIMDTTEA
ncbi:hypothetical protein SDC9_208183 [bioreactor metagenome]|uniref:Uncharacterized protein n=1 Tax=bioreactor metagenome TaxID=1076179 RepID=A0A645J9V6_9ZZZZ